MSAFNLSRRLLLLALVLVPMFASAQSLVTLRRSVDATADTYTFGTAACGDTITVQWTYNPLYLTGLVCLPLSLWTTTGSCGDSAVTANGDVPFSDVQYATLQQLKTSTFDVKVSSLPGFTTTTADGGTNTALCGTTGITKTHRVCGSYGLQSGSVACTKTPAASLTLIYDTQPPTAPIIVSSAGEDSAATVQFTVDSDAVSVVAEVKGPGATEFGYAREVAASTGQVRIDNLSNGDTWSIQLRAKDAAGNVSAASSAVDVVPVKTVGFYGVYRQQGGTDQGGCSAAGAAFVPFAALALARAFARRSRRS